MLKNLAGLLAALLSVLSAVAQEVDTTMWITNGTVTGIVRSGNTVYLNGDFTRVGPLTGNGATLNTRDGRVLSASFAKIEGLVKTALPDGAGGLYIGGEFERVGGLARMGIAHIKSDGQVDQDWDAKIGRWKGTVNSLALAGDVLYVGGDFSTVDGQVRQNLAALDARTARVTDWYCITNGPVKSMVLSGNTLYLGGDFSSIASSVSNFQSRSHLAALDVSTLVVQDWNPRADKPVHLLIQWGSTIFAAGDFQMLGDQPRRSLAALDAATGQVSAWNPSPDYSVSAMAVSGNTLYVGGSFNHIEGQPQCFLAAFDAATWQLTPWYPKPDLPVQTIAVAGGVVYLGGHFRALGTQGRDYLGAADATTGEVMPWNAGANAAVRSLFATGNSLFVGGYFSSVGMQYRYLNAALDAQTGEATDWNPGAYLKPSENVRPLAAARGRVYVAGSYNDGSTQLKYFLSALDAGTGVPTGWAPTIDGYINTTLLAGNTLYVAGRFSEINGQKRNDLAAIDVTTGQLTPWNPRLNDYALVADIKLWNGSIYIAGQFRSVNGQPRYNIAAIDAATGQVTAWNPGPVFTEYYEQTVASLGFSENTVYAGGNFVTSEPRSRRNAIAFDATTGEVTDWNPVLYTQLSEIIVTGDSVYLCKGFGENYGRQPYLFAVDRATGQTVRWESKVNGRILALTLHEGTLYAGGYFDRVQEQFRPNFVAFGKSASLNLSCLVKGKVYEDTNGNCLQDDTEQGIPGRIVVAYPGDYFASTDSLGNYSLRVDTGTYTVAHVLPLDLLEYTKQVCPLNPATYQVRLTRNERTIAAKDFASKTTLRPYLSVSVSSDRRRRCMTSTTTVSYCNTGNAAQNVQVHVQLPEYVALVSAKQPFTKDQDGNYVFSIGTVAAGSCGSIQLADSVVCNNPDIRGLAQCTRAWITPPNDRTPDLAWDRSNISLKARCGTNGRVRLGIYNTGTGNMADSSAYRIYLDAQLAFTRNFKLAPGDSLVLQVPANGRTVRLEADQRPAHPDKRQSNVTIEGCGTNSGGTVSKGFVCQLPQDDEEPEVAVECLPIIDSFDPNDKAVSPVGVTDQHYTPTGRALDYVVRFQNTGTDVAYQVVVVDTLSEHLDISTLRVGAVSHPYKLHVSGKGRPVLTFTFKDINLPDSTADEPRSHGRIQFSIRPKTDLPEKTRVENFADIFFDYNEPVRTNTTVNTLYDLPPVVVADVALAPSDVCPAANPVANAGANRTVCEQDTVKLAAGQPLEGNGRWQLVRGAGTVGQPNRPDATVTALAYGENVFQWRVPASRCGSDSLAASVTITRLQKPVAVITQSGADQLVCSVAGSRYEWFLDGTKLDKGGQRIQVTRSGRYTVRVEMADGCHPEVSEAYAYGVTGLVTGATAAVRVFPNPTTGRLVVHLPVWPGGPVHVTVVDKIGRTVLSQMFNPAGSAGEFRAELDLSAQATGLYVLKLQTAKGLIVRSVFKK